jgi:DnaJ family protein C protein 28
MSEDSSLPQHDQEARTSPAGSNRRQLVTAATYRSVVEQQIQDAVDEGKFDNLPGMGKPLVFEANPHAGDKELAYKLLKDNNFTLPWIADRNDLLERIETCRAKMGRQWQLYGAEVAALERSGQPAIARRRYLALVSQWETELDQINRRIHEVNLSLPVKSLEILKLLLEAELVRIGADRQP